ncbi:MAG: hypothetical protein PHQ00_04660 [Phycisphaerae bacterium]|nr:hypothetical protein [Phycisphaerae bacterium]
MGRSGRFFGLVIVTVLFSTACFAETHWNLQAVDEYGVYTHPDVGTSVIFTVEGIILNRPEEMVDTTQQWQIYIQGESADHAGTAVYMGKYNYPTGQFYSDANWASEIYRVEHDVNSSYEFQPGDRVRVTGLTWFYHGKSNINEQHKISPSYDFTIDLIDPAVGLPEPEVITLSMVVTEANAPIFDYTRAGGCELYQSRLVRINDVNIVGDNWDVGQELKIRDNTGRTFPLLLGRGKGFTKYQKPTGQIDVVGIFDQESTTEDPTIGYRLWVMNYDGNGSVLTDGCGLNGYFAGDINKDCVVDFTDFAIMAQDWLKCSNPSFYECVVP